MEAVGQSSVWTRLLIMVSDKEFRALGRALSPGDQYRLISAGLEEACTFIRHFEDTKSLDGWQSGKAAPWSSEALRRFMLGRPEWHDLLEKRGLSRFLAGAPEDDGRGNLASLAQPLQNLLRRMRVECVGVSSSGQHLLQSLLQCFDEATEPVKGQKTEDDTPSLDLEVCADIETELLQPWPRQKLQQGSRLHWGTILHHMVDSAKQHFGQQWPQRLILVSASAAQTAEMVSLQAGAAYILCVVSNDDHWALLCLQKGSHKALLLDAQQQEEVKLLACAFLVYMTSHWQHNLELYSTDQELQRDQWSCGHRVILAADAVMRHCLDPAAPWPPLLQEDDIGAAAVEELCRRGTRKEPEPDMFQSPPRKSRRTQPTKSEASASEPKPVKAEASLVKTQAADKTPSTPPKSKKPRIAETSPVHLKLAAPASPKVKTARTDADAAAVQKLVAVLDDDDEDAGDDSEDAAAAKPARKKKQSKKCKHVAAGKDLAIKAGIDFECRFQKKHRETGEVCRQGHWKKFLQALSDHGRLRCQACSLLRDLVHPPCTPPVIAEAGEQLVPAAEAAEAPEQPVEMDGIVKNKRGRPERGAELSSLADVLKACRPNTYRLCSGPRYFCVPCNEEVNFIRTTASGFSFVEKHEKTRKHSNGLRRLNPNAGEGGSLAPVAVQAPLPGVCPGLLVEDSTACPVQHIQQSIRAWADGGMLQFRAEPGMEQGTLSEISVQASGDALVLRHTGCTKVSTVAGPCVLCRKLLARKPYLQQIAEWALRLDMASLAYQCVYHQDRVHEYVMEMKTRDYASWCRETLDRCIGILNRCGVDGLHDHCTRQFLCINTSRYTPGLRSFVKSRIDGLRLMRDADERRAYEALCSNLDATLAGETDLRMAAWVASGGLSANEAVRALFRTFCESEKKKARGALRRPGSGKHICDDTRFELTFALGRGSQDLLNLFGASRSKSNKPKVDWQSPLLPRFFRLNTCSKEQQVHAAQQVADFLGASGKRVLCLSVDETVWRPTWQAISRLHDDSIAIIGGGWSPEAEKDMSCLSIKDARDEKYLSSMTLSIVATRADSNARSFETCLLPLPPGKGHRKAEVFLALLGERMEAFTKACGCPPVCISYDNGCSNARLNYMLLGMEQLEGVFWEKCSVVRPATIPFFPFRALVWTSPKGKKYGVHGMNDIYHTMKCFTLQHLAASRTVYHGGYAVDFSAMRRGGLPVQSFTARDPQSDRCSFQRLNTAYLGESWSCDGLRLMILLASFMCAATLGKLLPPAAFQNASLSYFLVLLHMSENRRCFGDRWQEYSLPYQTCRNTAHLMCHVMVSCVMSSAETPWNLAARQERVCESHFSQVKSPFTGKPCIADAMHGTFLHHLRQVQQCRRTKFPDYQPVRLVTPAEAEDLASRSLQDAVFFQACISRGRTEAQIRKDLDHWWETDGKDLLTSHRDVEEMAEDEENPGDWCEELCDDEAEQEKDDQDQEAAVVLAACDDHVKVKDDISALSAQIAEEPVPLQKIPAELEKALDDNQQATLHVAAFMNKVRQLPSLQLNPEEEGVNVALQRRMEEVRPLIQAYAEGVQLAQGELSKAMIMQTSAPQENQWNIVQHELALGRQASLLAGGQRSSRLHAWTSQQMTLAAAATAQTSVVEAVMFFAEGQVLLYLNKGGNVQAALSQTVFRGAVLKSQKGPRRLHTSRPAVGALPLSCCGAIRVVDLLEATPTTYLATGLNPVRLIDPITVVGKLAPAEMIQHPSKTVIKFTSQGIAEIAKFVQAESWKKNAAADATAIPGLTERQFTPAQASRNIPAYLQRLPAMFQKVQIELLQDGQLKLGSKTIDWASFCLRTQSYFDVILAGKAPLMYSRQVFCQMLDLHPSRSGALQRIRVFAGKVNDLAPTSGTRVPGSHSARPVVRPALKRTRRAPKIILLSFFDGIGAAPALVENLFGQPVLALAWEIDATCRRLASARLPCRGSSTEATSPGSVAAAIRKADPTGECTVIVT
ncbi:abcB2 [Symbiodinium sp. CCMP2592]|nr:abcB2 [Symbiodinium sp. CCMP2592]